MGAGLAKCKDKFGQQLDELKKQLDACKSDLETNKTTYEQNLSNKIDECNVEKNNLNEQCNAAKQAMQDAFDKEKQDLADKCDAEKKNLEDQYKQDLKQCEDDKNDLKDKILKNLEKCETDKKNLENKYKKDLEDLENKYKQDLEDLKKKYQDNIDALNKSLSECNKKVVDLQKELQAEKEKCKKEKLLISRIKMHGEIDGLCEVFLNKTNDSDKAGIYKDVLDKQGKTNYYYVKQFFMNGSTAKDYEQNNSSEIHNSIFESDYLQLDESDIKSYSYEYEESEQIMWNEYIKSDEYKYAYECTTKKNYDSDDDYVIYQDPEYAWFLKSYLLDIVMVGVLNLSKRPINESNAKCIHVSYKQFVNIYKTFYYIDSLFRQFDKNGDSRISKCEAEELLNIFCKQDDFQKCASKILDQFDEEVDQCGKSTNKGNCHDCENKGSIDFAHFVKWIVGCICYSIDKKDKIDPNDCHNDCKNN